MTLLHKKHDVRNLPLHPESILIPQGKQIKKMASIMNFIKASNVFEMMNSAQGQQYLFAVDFDLDRGFFMLNPDKQSKVLWRVRGASNFSNEAVPPLTQKRFDSQPINFNDYESKFEIVRRGLQSGNSFLTNLTLCTPLSLDYTLDEIARYSNSPYILMVPEEFVCFSPETFVQINTNGVISSKPMKGTIDATLCNATQTLMNDPKEQAEHNTIVDLIRNDLSIVANGVSVERFRYTEKLKTLTGEIIQTSSLIHGNLNEEYRNRMGDVMSSVLPAGSVSGAPKEATMRIIKEAEVLSRGFYCGVFGYSDGHSIDSAVMIRYIEKNENQYYFRSGSGVTANSNAKSEYEECIKKIYLPFEQA